MEDERVARILRVMPGVLLAFIIIVHFLFLLAHFAPAISTPDAHGYWFQARLLATSGHTWFVPQSAIQYIDQAHWYPAASGRYYSMYPPGLPLIAAAVYRLFGYGASLLVNPILASLSLLGFFLLLRLVLGPWWGLAGVSLLAVNPVFNQQALWSFAHIAVLFCLVWGSYFLLRWSVRRKPWEAFLAGLFFGCIPAIRYPEALFVLAAAAFFLWNLRKHRRALAHGLPALAGAALPLVPLLIRNQLAFGAFYRTGYSFAQGTMGFDFGWSYFGKNFGQYILSFYKVGLGLLLFTGLAGMVGMCLDRRSRRIGALSLLLTIPLLLLYSFYFWPANPQAVATMRFLIPTFVFYILGTLWLAKFAAEQVSIRLQRPGEISRITAVLAPSIVAALLLYGFLWGGSLALAEARRVHYQNTVLARVADALEGNIENGDVVIAHPQIQQNLDCVGLWRLADLTSLGPGPGERAQDGGLPAGPNGTGPREDEGRIGVGGPAGQVRESWMASQLAEWAGGNRVYYVGTRQDLERMRGKFFNQESFWIVSTISIPAPADIPVAEPLKGNGRAQGDPAKDWWSALQGESELVVAEWSSGAP